MERELIFNSALKLIRDGRFAGSPMSEIAYHARLTELTASYFFQTREKLLTELASYIADGIKSAVDESGRAGVPFEKTFFKIWLSLYHFYLKHPGAVAFVEQSANLTALCEEKLSEKKFIAPLIEFFHDHFEVAPNGFHAETLASVFHGSIITAVKLKTSAFPACTDREIKSLPLILWRGIIEMQPVTT